MSHTQIADDLEELSDIADVSENEDGDLTISADFFNTWDRNSGELAKMFIRRFFEAKEMYCGGSIPIHALTSPSQVQMCLNTSVSEAVVQAHAMLANHPDYAECDPDEDGEDASVKLIASVIDELRFAVPKPFQGGCLLMFLTHCKGIPLLQNRVTVSLY
jgi:hypothetical protein